MKKLPALTLALTLWSFGAAAQTAMTRAQLYQNTTPSPSFNANLIASIPTLSDGGTFTGSTIFAHGSTIFSEGSLNITTNLPTITTCGTGTPTITAHSSNNSGELTLGTGSPTACTLTWNANSLYSNDTFCTFTPGASNSAAITGGYYVSAHSASGVTLTLGTGTSSAVFEYTCFGN